jgi:hypothetical protein
MNLSNVSKLAGVQHRQMIGMTRICIGTERMGFALAAVTPFVLLFFLFVCFLTLSCVTCFSYEDMQHPRRGVADLKGGADNTELAANHVFCWFTEERQSPFLHTFCIQVSTRKLTKCLCLHPVLNTMNSGGTNNDRILKEVSA